MPKKFIQITKPPSSLFCINKTRNNLFYFALFIFIYLFVCFHLASSKLRPPKPPPYTNKEKWNRMNNGQKLYAMRQYNLSLIRRGLPVDKTLPGSFNFKSSNFTFSAIPYG